MKDREPNHAFAERFDLRPNGGMRADAFIHNGRWFDKQGNWIGWGDLSKADIENLQNGLAEDEAFLIVIEYDDYVHQRDNPGVLLTGKDVYASTSYVIRSGSRYRVEPEAEGISFRESSDVIWGVIPKNELWDFIN